MVVDIFELLHRGMIGCCKYHRTVSTVTMSPLGSASMGSLVIHRHREAAVRGNYSWLEPHAREAYKTDSERVCPDNLEKSLNF